MLPNSVIEIVSKVSPFIGGLLGGPVGSVVGNLVSSAFGGIDMNDSKQVEHALTWPGNVARLKELELQLSDIQNARLFAEKDNNKWIRLALAVLAMFAVFADIIAIQYVTDKMLNEILIMMLVFLVWDIRQIYTFYFGKSGEMPEMPFVRKK